MLHAKPSKIIPQSLLYALICVPLTALVIAPLIMPFLYVRRVKKSLDKDEFSILAKSRHIALLVASAAAIVGIRYFVVEQVKGYAFASLGLIIVPSLFSIVFILVLSGRLYDSFAKTIASRIYSVAIIALCTLLIGWTLYSTFTIPPYGV
jgi:hypothetical protein